jgi:hypothetical protein
MDPFGPGNSADAPQSVQHQNCKKSSQPDLQDDRQSRNDAGLWAGKVSLKLGELELHRFSDVEVGVGRDRCKGWRGQ